MPETPPIRKLLKLEGAAFLGAVILIYYGPYILEREGRQSRELGREKSCRLRVAADIWRGS